MRLCNLALRTFKVVRRVPPQKALRKESILGRDKGDMIRKRKSWSQIRLKWKSTEVTSKESKEGKQVWRGRRKKTLKEEPGRSSNCKLSYFNYYTYIMPLLNLFIPLGTRYMFEVMKFVSRKQKVYQGSVPLLWCYQLNWFICSHTLLKDYFFSWKVADGCDIMKCWKVSSPRCS